MTKLNSHSGKKEKNNNYVEVFHAITALGTSGNFEKCSKVTQSYNWVCLYYETYNGFASFLGGRGTRCIMVYVKMVN